MIQLGRGEWFGEPDKVVYGPGFIVADVEHIPNKVIPWHFHENSNFTFLVKGEMKEVSKGAVVTCVPDTLLFHYSQDPHVNTNHSSSLRFFHNEIEQSWYEKHHVNPGYLMGSRQIQNPFIKSLFRKIKTESQINDSFSALAIEGLLMQAITGLLRVNMPAERKIPEWSSRLGEIIQDDSVPHSLESMSREVGVHPVYLSQQFSKYFGTTFTDYVKQKRIQKVYTKYADGYFTDQLKWIKRQTL